MKREYPCIATILKCAEAPHIEGRSVKVFGESTEKGTCHGWYFVEVPRHWVPGLVPGDWICPPEALSF